MTFKHPFKNKITDIIFDYNSSIYLKKNEIFVLDYQVGLILYKNPTHQPTFKK